MLLGSLPLVSRLEGAVLLDEAGQCRQPPVDDGLTVLGRAWRRFTFGQAVLSQEDRDDLRQVRLGVDLPEDDLELLALRWSDVDLESGRLTIRHTLRRGVRTLADPKTDASKRTLHLGSVAATLRAHRTRQLEERIAAGRRWRDGDFVFVTKLGEPLDTSTVTRAFQAALRRAGLARQRFHDLRHATATLHLEAGEELIVVSRLLGHSTISTTADVYAHVTPAMLDRTADRMDGILGRKVETA